MYVVNAPINAEKLRIKNTFMNTYQQDIACKTHSFVASMSQNGASLYTMLLNRAHRRTVPVLFLEGTVA